MPLNATINTIEILWYHTLNTPMDLILPSMNHLIQDLSM
jgi:hypothetical protein